MKGLGWFRGISSWPVLAALCGLAAAWASRAGAQSEAALQREPAAYRATVDEALQEFEARNFEESRALFVRAHQLYPNARTQRGLGFAEFELRNYGECIRQLEAALRSPVKPLEGALRSDTERLLARANNFVARLFVDTKPPIARLSVDGAAVEVVAGESLLLQIGEHTLELHAPGFRPERRHISVSGGTDQRLTIVLLKDEGAQSTSTTTTPERRWYKSPWLWSALGAVALGAAGTTLALTLGGGTTHERANGGSADAVLMGPTK
jgi:hypothetical protein